MDWGAIVHGVAKREHNWLTDTFTFPLVISSRWLLRAWCHFPGTSGCYAQEWSCSVGQRKPPGKETLVLTGRQLMCSEVLRIGEAAQATNSIYYNPNPAPLKPCALCQVTLFRHCFSKVMKRKQKSLQQEDRWARVSVPATMLAPKMFIHHLPSLPLFVEALLLSQHFCGLGGLSGGVIQFFMGYTGRSKSQVMMWSGGFGNSWLIQGGAGCMVPWCPMFRPSAIPWAQKDSGAAFCWWRALCFRCQGRAPNLKGRGLHCDSLVEARQRLYRRECHRILWSWSLSARVACTTSGPAAAFSLASGPLCLGCYNQIPQTGWLKQQKFTVS